MFCTILNIFNHSVNVRLYAWNIVLYSEEKFTESLVSSNGHVRDNNLGKPDEYLSIARVYASNYPTCPKIRYLQIMVNSLTTEKADDKFFVFEI